VSLSNCSWALAMSYLFLDSVVLPCYSRTVAIFFGRFSDASCQLLFLDSCDRFTLLFLDYYDPLRTLCGRFRMFVCALEVIKNYTITTSRYYNPCPQFVRSDLLRGKRLPSSYFTISPLILLISVS
jgi:hypothetical protein